MDNWIKIALTICWIILFTFWIISSKNVKKSENKESFIKRFALYWLPIIIAILLLGPGEWFGNSLIRENFVEHTNFVGILGLVFCYTGLFLAIWSRHLLGKNWSLAVQKKENHELITNGIYKILRHPIYTGILLIFIGNTLIVGDYRGLIAVAIVFISFLSKLKKEEKWLIELFGNHYIEYKKKSKMLIPFIF